MKQLLPTTLLLLLLSLLPSCKRSTPDNVVPPDELVDLLVDIHTSESYIETGFESFSDARKRSVRASVLHKYGLDREQFDTTLMWYGKHIETYLEVYDEVIARLVAEDAHLTALIEQENAQTLTLSGDSVNIWKGAPTYQFDTQADRALLTFNILADNNFSPKDKFTLRMQLHTLPYMQVVNLVATVAIKYKWSREVQYVTQSFLADGELHVELAGGEEAIERVYGSVHLPLQSTTLLPQTIYADSISLVRLHQ